MARIVPLAPFDTEFFAGQETLDVPAGTIFELVRALDAIGPGFAQKAETRIAFAVDGALVTDWSSPLTAESEVLLVPRLAGG